MNEPVLTFVELERRIAGIPDGPSAVFNTPRVLVWLNVIGTTGLVVGLLPSLFVHFFEPQMWMVWMARAGLIVEIVFFAPYFFRTVWVLVSEMWRWRPKLAEQLDHDAGQFHALTRWLVGFPKPLIQEQLRFVEAAQQRMGVKIGLLAGSADRLGIVPLLISLVITLNHVHDLTDIPPWQAFLAMLLAIVWLISWLAATMRLRLQLYAFLLANALEQKGG
ncbi:MAG: hypothetical protein QM761_01915 [Pseudoxanthomonas sp.]